MTCCFEALGSLVTPAGHDYAKATKNHTTNGLYARINSAFDARMLVHFRLWRLNRRM